MFPCKSPHRTLILLGLALQLNYALGETDPSDPGASPVPVARPNLAKLNQKAIHEEYVNGNFENVIERISVFQKENPRHSRDDSVFIALHLGVVHSANPKSVEAGKHWMHRLIRLSPTADLSGMYVSEEIDRLFEKVKQEAGIRPGGHGSRKWVWLGAGGTALAAAVTAWMVFDGDSHGKARTVVEADL